MVLKSKKNKNKRKRSKRSKRNLKGGSKKKIILCLFGVIERSIIYTFESIQRNILNVLKQEYDIDIYINSINMGDHLESIRGLEKNIKLNRDDINVIPYNFIEVIDKSDLDKIISTKKCSWRKDYTPTHINNALRQLYSEEQVGKFILKNADKYDLALVIGPDYYYSQPINLDHLKLCLTKPCVYTAVINDAEGYTNGFYFGKPEVVSKVAIRFSHFDDWQCKLQRDYEKLFKYAFDINHIEREPTNMVFFKIRATMDVHLQGKLKNLLKFDHVFSKMDILNIFNEYVKICKHANIQPFRK